MKKYNKMFQRITLLLAMGLFVTSCEKFTNGVSEYDPTLPRDASLGQVLNAAEVNYVGFVEGELTRIAGMWSGHFTGTDRQYVTLDNYVSTAPDYDNGWANLYAGALKSLKIAERKATENNNRRALGLAQVLEIHTMLSATSMFGDVPYTEMYNVTEFPNPAFDSQKSIYTALLALADQAIENLNAKSGTYSGDYFGVSDAALLGAVNTLKAKMYLNLGDYQNALDAANLGIAKGGDLISPHMGNYNLDMNIYYSFLVQDRPGYMGATNSHSARMLDPTNTAAAFNKNKAGITDESDRFAFIYTGDLAEGYDLNASEDDVAMFSPTASFPLITYRENVLIQAEALLRLGKDTEALASLNAYRDYLNKGGYLTDDYFTGAGKYKPFTAANFVSGGSENPDGLADKDALYRSIIAEKYVSMIGTLETFVDLHRKGFGSFSGKQNWEVIGLTPTTGSNIPQRLLIAQSEINTNTSTPRPSPGLFDNTEIFK